MTGPQVSGWRFLLRRTSSGVALRDTSMLSDPIRQQSRGLWYGALLGMVVIVGAVVVSLMKPAGRPGGATILSDRSSSALYVVLNSTLHPVLNLTSAQLITGAHHDPTPVASAELDKYPRGAQLGIPLAPERLVQRQDKDGDWTVCAAQAGPHVGVTVIAQPPATVEGGAAPLADDKALLVAAEDGPELVWQGRRSPVDLTPAVTASLGLGVDSPLPLRLPAALLNLVPKAPQLTVPPIPDAGSPPPYQLPADLPVGSVFVEQTPAAQKRYWAVLPAGIQQIPLTVATMLRNTNSYGKPEITALPPDAVSRLPKANDIPISDYPPVPVHLVDPEKDPVSCVRWTRRDGAARSQTVVLSGQRLPTDPAMPPISLAAGEEGSAARAVLPRGVGRLVRATGIDPASPRQEGLFWVSDLGVRFGVDYDPQPAAAGNAASHRTTLTALGLREPATPCPWPVLKLLPPGPTLSKLDALTEHTVSTVGEAVLAPQAEESASQATTPAAPTAPPSPPPPTAPPVQTTVTLVPSPSAPPARRQHRSDDDTEDPDEARDREDGPGS